jgi:hypothetical protein
VDATDDNDEPAYVSELRIGRFGVILLAVLVAMACTLASGIYFPTPADRLWALVSRKALPEHVAPFDDSTVITLIRTMCEGWCPGYRVQIYGSGKVEYVGIHYVCTFGEHVATADAREVRRLVEAMIATGYFGYSWKQGPFWIDAPTVTSVLQHGGRSRTLPHDHGDRGAPRWLHDMEDEIDRVAGTARWLPRASKETGWRPLCLSAEGGERDVTFSDPGEQRTPYRLRL